MVTRPLFVAVLVLSLAACAPLSLRRPRLPSPARPAASTLPLAIDPTLAPRTRIAVVHLVGERGRAAAGLGGEFGAGMLGQLNRCATGPQPLELRIRVARIGRGWRRPDLAPGQFELSVLAELVDLRSGVVVGRYPLGTAGRADPAPEESIAGRQRQVGDSFGRMLCWQAFGRR